MVDRLPEVRGKCRISPHHSRAAISPPLQTSILLLWHEIYDLLTGFFNAAVSRARGPEGLIDGEAPGAMPRLADAHRRALAAIVESGPIPAIHGVGVSTV
jgi:hypothetical protein